MPVLIAAACRTPFTRVDGALAEWHPVDLAAAAMNEVLRHADAPADSVDEVWFGCAEPVGAQGADMARAAALAAGWPDRIGGTVIDRAETSGTGALHAAAAAIRSGEIGSAVVVGVCSSSLVPPGASALARAYGRPWGDGPAIRAQAAGGLLPSPAAADHAATEAGIDRRAQELWTSGSHQRRGLVESAGLMTIDARPGDHAPIQRGTPIRADHRRSLPEDPSSLPPSFDPAGAVTAFTFAPPADGVAALLLVDGDGRTPAAEIIGTGRAAGDPRDPLGGVDLALRAAQQRAGCDTADIARWEIVEPTAAAVLLAMRRLGLEGERVNPAGGTLGVGDAAAAEELRLITDAITTMSAGALLAALAFGPSGSAVTIIRCP